jgi:hypothetical protein
MLEDLSTQSRGILFGTICAIVFTPVVVRFLQRTFPPRKQHGASLAPLVFAHCRKIAKQGAYSGLCSVAIPAIAFGPSTPVTFKGGLMLLGLLFVGPAIWIAIALLRGGTVRIREFSLYFEQEFGISFPKTAGLFVGASLIGLGWLTAFAIES